MSQPLQSKAALRYMLVQRLERLNNFTNLEAAVKIWDQINTRCLIWT